MFLSIDLSAVIPPVRTGLQTCFQFTHAHILLMGQPWGALVFKLGITLLTAVTEVKFQRIIHNKNKRCCVTPLVLFLSLPTAHVRSSPSSTQLPNGSLSLSKLLGILPSCLPPIWLVLAYCHLIISISQATFTSFLFFMLFAVVLAEFLGKLISFSPACPKLSWALPICSPAPLNPSHIGSTDRYLHGEQFKSNILLLWII